MQKAPQCGVFFVWNKLDPAGKSRVGRVFAGLAGSRSTPMAVLRHASAPAHATALVGGALAAMLVSCSLRPFAAKAPPTGSVRHRFSWEGLRPRCFRAALLLARLQWLALPALTTG